MQNWTQEAKEYLDGYLNQVAVLAKHQGDDADDIVNGLRDHVEHELQMSSDGTVSIELLLAVLNGIGGPAEVANLDTSIRIVPMADPGSEVSEPFATSRNLLSWSGIGKLTAALVAVGLIILVSDFLIQLVYPKGPGTSGNSTQMEQHHNGEPDVIRIQRLN